MLDRVLNKIGKLGVTALCDSTAEEQLVAAAKGGDEGAFETLFNRHQRVAVKPLLVFAAAPYGVIGSLIALAIMHTPFGFMAFLGIASLIGVIVSHVIVLFDFIEEMHAKGEPLVQALADAGIQRIRPVMIPIE